MTHATHTHTATSLYRIGLWKSVTQTIRPTENVDDTLHKVEKSFGRMNDFRVIGLFGMAHVCELVSGWYLKCISMVCATALPTECVTAILAYFFR